MRNLTLFIHTDKSPPVKSEWSSTDKSQRDEWNRIYEEVANWFCESNSFRKEYSCIIKINNITIKLDGATIRYLAPNMRSVASLISKAYNKGVSLPSGDESESTPGIYASKDKILELSLPIYHIELNSDKISKIPKMGTVCSTKYNNSEELYLPATTPSQAIIWLNYAK